MVGISRTKLTEEYSKLEIPSIERFKQLIESSKIEVYLSKSRVSAIIGRFIVSETDELCDDLLFEALGIFEILGRLTFESDDSIVSHYSGSPTLTADKVIVSSDWRRKGLGLTLYLTLIYNGFSIVSSWEQYDNARRLWRSLSRNFPDVYVDVYDVKENILVKSKHTIKNVEFDNLDEEWSADNARNLRFIAYLGDFMEYRLNVDAFCDSEIGDIARDEKGLPLNGVVKDYYENGELKYEGTFKDGKEEGIEKRYFKSGHIERETPYKDGEKNGIEKRYFESGHIERETPYKDGEKNGIEKRYFESGKIKWEIPYKDDKKDGIERDYYESGNIYWETLYVDGKKEGIDKRYYENGNISWESAYKDGKQDGIEREYCMNGEIKEEIHYKNGKKVEL